MSEGPPKNPEQPPVPTEAVLADFRRNCELEVGHVYDVDERKVIAHTLHSKLERLNTAEMLHKYEDGVVPTTDSMARAAQVAIEALTADPEDTEALAHAKLLEGQGAQIRRWCRRYVETIVRFHTTRASYMRMSDEEQRDMFVRADTERRRVHDALLSSLGSFNELLRNGQDLADYPLPIMWKPGMELEQGTTLTHPATFAPEAIRDRDLIRDWAIIADGVEQLRTLVHRMELTEQNNTATHEERP